MIRSTDTMNTDKQKILKIRVGCCTNMIAGRKDGIGAEHAPELAGWGYDYLELPLAEIMQLADRDFADLATFLEQQPIGCEACNNFFPKTLRLTGPEADLPRIVDYAHRAIERASAIGAEYIVFGSGPAKTVPQGFPLEAGYAQIVTMLQSIAPLAAKSKIGIVIEPLRQAECNLINTFAEGCRLAGDVNREEVKVLVDYYHLSVEEEPLDNLRQLGSRYLRHVHFANPLGRVFPAEKDTADYDPFSQILEEIGYRGRVSVEAHTDSLAQAAPLALNLFRRWQNGL